MYGRDYLHYTYACLNKTNQWNGKTMKNLTLIVMAAIVLGGCVETRIIDSSGADLQRITLAKVQSISQGDTGASVIEALGSPEIITKSDNGGEVWIYDKVSIYQEAEAGATGVFSSAKTSVRASKSLMVTVYLDSERKVTDTNYRSMRY